MQERIVEIIVYLLSEIHQERRRKDKVDLTSALQLKGYTEIEINLAFSWIFEHLRKPPSEVFNGGAGEDFEYVGSRESGHHSRCIRLSDPVDASWNYERPGYGNIHRTRTGLRQGRYLGG